MYITSLGAYQDEDEKNLETYDEQEATDYYEELLSAYDEDKHIYLELVKYYETEYRPYTEVLRLYTGKCL